MFSSSTRPLRPLLLCLTLLLWASDLAAQMPAGTEFIVAVPALWRRAELIDPGEIRIMVMATRETEVTLRWSGPGGALLDRVLVQAGGRAMFATQTLFQTVNIMQQNDDRRPVEVNQRSFLVESSEPISVFVLYDHYAEREFNGRSKTEMWSVPPTSAYDTSYVVNIEPGSEDWGDRTGFLIIAKENGTEVTWEPTVRWGYVSPVEPAPGTITMNREQVYQVLSWDRGDSAADLSGTTITSNRPIAVLPFSLGADISNERKSTLAEHQFSSSEAGTLFYSLAHRVKLVALEDSTTVRFNDVLLGTLLNRGDVFTGEGGKYETGRPVTAMQFLDRGSTGNPSMAALPPVRNYASKLQWINPHLDDRPEESGNHWRHYVAITAPKSAEGSVELDGDPVNFDVTFAGGEYVGTILPLNPKGYVLKADAPISAMAYGLAVDDAYAYLAGEGVQSIIAADTDTLTLRTCDSIGDLSLMLSNEGNLLYRVDSIIAEGVTLQAVRFPPSFPTLMPPGREIELRLRFALPSAQTYTGTVRIYSDALNETVTTLPFRIVRDSARLAVPDRIEFGQIESGTTRVDTTIVIVNEGDDSLRIATLFSSNDRYEILSPTDLPLTLGPGETDSIRLRVTPRSGIIEEGTIDILGEPCFTPIRIDLSAFRGAGALLGIESRIDFPGEICDPDRVSDTTLMLRAVGDEPLDISEIRLAGDNPEIFSILANPAPILLPPGDTAFVSLRYQPTGFGAHRARLEIESNGVNVADPAVIELWGSRDTATIEPDTTELNFARLLPCTPFATKELRLRNRIGTMAAEILELRLSDGTSFSLPGTPPASLPPRGGERIVEVLFSPSSDGDFVDTLTIIGRPCNIEEKVILRGSRRTPGLVSDVDSLDFEPLYLCELSSRTKRLRLTNNGETGDTIHGAEPGGDTVFTLTGANGARISWPILLSPGESFDLEVHFAPPEGGSFNGAVTFDWGPCDGTERVTFRGSALQPEVGTSTDRIDFGQVDVDAGGVRKSVTITNRSDIPREITTLDLGNAGSEIRRVSPSSLPVIIPPGGELTFEFEFDPEQIGSLAEIATISISAPCPQKLKVTILGEGIGELVEKGLLGLKVPNYLEGNVAERVKIPVTIGEGTSLGNVAVSGIEVVLRWASSLLYPEELTTTLPGWNGTIVDNRIEDGRRQVQLRFEGDPGEIREGEMFGYVTALVLLGDQDTTAITLDLVDITTPPSSFLSVTLDPGDFTAFGICRIDGDRLLASRGPLKLGVPWPNPGDRVIEMPIRLEREGRLRVAIYDALGIEREVAVDRQVGAGEQRVRLDVSRLSPGAYICRIEFEGYGLGRAILVRR